METINLKAHARDAQAQKAQDTRNDGFIPAECYGAGQENLQVKLDYQEFRRAYIKAGSSTIINLETENGTKKVLVKDVQFHPVSGKMIHVDFVFLNMKKKIHANIPFVLEGEAPAVKEFGGIVLHGKETVAVKCLPTDLVHEIKVDISGLKELHATLKLSDINIPATLEVLDDMESMVVSIAVPREEVEAPAAEAVPAEGEAAPAAEGAAAPAEEKKE